MAPQYSCTRHFPTAIRVTFYIRIYIFRTAILFFIFYKRVQSIFALPPQRIVAAIFLVLTLLRELQIRLYWAHIRHSIGSFSQDRTVPSWAENRNQRPTMQILVSPFNYSVVHLTPKYFGCSDNFGTLQ